MMRKVITKKVPGGKLFRLDVDIDNLKIDDIKITGDFFMHPETTIIMIEEVIKGTSIKFDKQRVVDMTNIVLKLNNTQLLGFNANDLADALYEVTLHEI